MLKKFWALFALVALTGALVGAVASTAGSVATQNVPLNNDTADVETDCPDTIHDFWHFVITPNNGTFTIVSITLNLDGTLTTFSGSQIIPNGTQTDNVFVQVPAGVLLTDLEASGSFATVTPDSPAPTNFTLSHVCKGVPPTTTTTAPTTTTTTAKPVPAAATFTG
jgi:hypothetical protein